MQIKQWSIAILIVVISTVLFYSNTQQKEPWAPSQLLAPKVLADKINQNKAPIILNIGPSGTIKNAIDVGEGREESTLSIIAKTLKNTPKNQEIVMYCGCCPFANCPNVRPVFAYLTQQGFTHHTLLNLPQNLKVDWIDQKYPMQEE